MLKIGDKAPDFTLMNQHGQKIQLASFLGQRVIVYFYSKDNTSGCTKEACSFRDHYPAYLEKGIVVIGISPNDEKSHARFSEQHALPFILLSDLDRTVIQAFGAWGEKKSYGKTYMGLIRSTFVIDEQGKIEKVWAKVNTATHGRDVLDSL